MNYRQNSMKNKKTLMLVRSSWGLPQYAGSSRDVPKFTGHERGLNKVRF